MLKLLKALFFTAGPKYSWKKATLVISLSTSVVLSLAICGYCVRSTAQRFQVRKAAGVVQAIIQTGSQNSALTGLQFCPLPSGFLAEALDISADCPVHLSQFDLEVARDRLLATHIIENVRLKKMKPNLLFVDYTLREPWAYLEDYSNTAIDASGFFFPITPFYSPRYLPRIYLGEHAPPDPWGGQMPNLSLSLSRILATSLQGEDIERIDLSQAQASCAGRREIVLTLRNGAILRLTPKNCVQQLAHYSILKTALLSRDNRRVIIDLRIPEVAYIQRMQDEG